MRRESLKNDKYEKDNDGKWQFWKGTSENTIMEIKLVTIVFCDAYGVLDDLFPMLQRIRDSAAGVGPSFCDIMASIASRPALPGIMLGEDSLPCTTGGAPAPQFFDPTYTQPYLNHSA